MRILLVYCHPSPTSFVASICEALVRELAAKGHEIEVFDLYGEGFDPVLDSAGWRAHRDGRNAAADLSRHIAALQAAEGLILVYPTWWYGLPAMLKGWFDRVWQPGVAFCLKDGVFQLHRLGALRRFAVVTTYGSPGSFIRFIVGDPARKQVMRGLSLQFARRLRRQWQAIYDVDRRSESDLSQARNRAVGRIVRQMDAN
jgi:putative NADPH-quinone reductase